MAKAADALAPVLSSLLGDQIPVHVRLWDDSTLGNPASPATVMIHTPHALRRILYQPNELGFSRAYVTGEIDIQGDAFFALTALDTAPPELRLGIRTWATTLKATARLGVLGPPLPPPPEEARLRGGAHSQARDAVAIAHHYDVGNQFYQLVLGPSMTYSCARFVDPSVSLEQAQAAKYELICNKLGLRPGLRMLDVGCGWGGMTRHAASCHGVSAVGITLSAQQREWAVQRVIEEQLGDQVEIRLQDYRDLGGERYDAVSSIGMFEHVGKARLGQYFEVLFALLEPGGRLLNHAISTPGGTDYDDTSFLLRYVFPDGELQDVAIVVAAMQEAGFEVRDVEALREHYALTLRRWLDNLEAHWDQAVALVGPARARIWRLYMTGSVLSFESGEISIHQVLGVKPASNGESGMPLTRASFG